MMMLCTFFPMLYVGAVMTFLQLVWTVYIDCCVH